MARLLLLLPPLEQLLPFFQLLLLPLLQGVGPRPHLPFAALFQLVHELLPGLLLLLLQLFQAFPQLLALLGEHLVEVLPPRFQQLAALFLQLVLEPLLEAIPQLLLLLFLLAGMLLPELLLALALLRQVLLPEVLLELRLLLGKLLVELFGSPLLLGGRPPQDLVQLRQVLPGEVLRSPRELVAQQLRPLGRPLDQLLDMPLFQVRQRGLELILVLLPELHLQLLLLRLVLLVELFSVPLQLVRVSCFQIRLGLGRFRLVLRVHRFNVLS